MAKGFKHGAGGMSELNFKVVGGTSQPVNPKENTIWVNTETEISGWLFSAEDPGSPVEGMVWIILGTTSEVPFNALKKGELYCFPTSCEQYVGGSWASVDAYIYQGGQWLQFSSESHYLAVYDSGVENVPLTLIGFTRKASVLQASLGTNGGGAYIKTSSAIDITYNSALNVTCSYIGGEGTFAGYFYARILNTDGGVVAEKSSARNTKGTISLDISSLTGSYIVAAYADNSSGSYGGSCNISKIELLE